MTMTDTEKPRLTGDLVTMALENGLLDESIPAIQLVLDHRKEYLQNRKVAALVSGDRFYVQNCSPKKWIDELVEFRYRDGIRIVTHLTEEQQRRLKCGRVANFRVSHVGYVLPAGTKSVQDL